MLAAKRQQSRETSSIDKYKAATKFAISAFVHEKNVEVYQNLAGYRSENNFVGPTK